MKNRLNLLRQLDRQLALLRQSSICYCPKQGWVRTIRKALGMTIKQLAGRLGVHSSRVVKIEMAETTGAVNLKTLQMLAPALECTFFYAFIPRKELEKIIKERAKIIASKQLKYTSSTMDLEAQSVDHAWLEQQLNDLIEDLLHQSWKHLWEE